jgi:hypothetical protein
MKHLKYLIITVILFFAVKNSAEATNLRGRLLHFDIYSRQYFPVQNTRVDIWVFNGMQWVDCGYSYTGTDGMYYFQNFTPGVNFKIQVNGGFYPAQSWFLTSVPLFDIPQLFL